MNKTRPVHWSCDCDRDDAEVVERHGLGECPEIDARVAEREKRIATWESRGDYLRDMAKDRG